MLCMLGMRELPFWSWKVKKKEQLLHPQLHQHYPAGAWGDALHAGDAGAAFWSSKVKKKRQPLHPQRYQHHAAGAWGDALHAGDAGAAFLVFESQGKKAAFASPVTSIILQVPGVMLHAGDAGAAFLVLESQEKRQLLHPQRELPFWSWRPGNKGSFCIRSFTSIILQVTWGDALHAGDEGAAFLVLESQEKQAAFASPQLHQHYPAGAWGDALHAGDAGAAFLVFESQEKRLLHAQSRAGKKAAFASPALPASSCKCGVMLCMLGMQELPSWSWKVKTKCSFCIPSHQREKRQLLHPQLYQHHPASAWGDALHAGDAGLPFWSWKVKKKAAFASPASPASSCKCLA